VILDLHPESGQHQNSSSRPLPMPTNMVDVHQRVGYLANRRHTDTRADHNLLRLYGAQDRK